MTEEKKEETWIDTTSKHLMALTHLSWEIESVANAFYTIGNVTMSDRLSEWANEVMEAKKAFQDVTGILSSEMYRQSREATGNILLAALEVGNNYEKGLKDGKKMAQTKV